MDGYKFVPLLVFLMVGCYLPTAVAVPGNTSIDSEVQTEIHTCLWDFGENISLDLYPDKYTAPFFNISIIREYTRFCGPTNALTSADFNNDGLLDFATGGETENIYKCLIKVFYGTGACTFREENITPPITGPIWDIDAGDFNRDGYTDILLSRGYDYGSNDSEGTWWLKDVIEILWNKNGTFNFFQRTRIMTILTICRNVNGSVVTNSTIIEYNLVSIEGQNGNSWHVPFMAVADFNLDGYDDFVISCNNAIPTLFINNKRNGFECRGTIYDYGVLGKGITAADFNGDGYPDLLVAAQSDNSSTFNDTAHIYLKLNKRIPDYFDRVSPGILIAHLPTEFVREHYGGSLLAGTLDTMDYNKDGLIDIVFGEANVLHVFIQQSNFTFREYIASIFMDKKVTWANTFDEGGFATGDFNYDGWDDIIAGGNIGKLWLLLNNKTFISIMKPADMWIYLLGKKWISIPPTMKLIIGPINVTVEKLVPLSRVDFYLNGKLVYTDTSEPFEWRWRKPGFGKYTLYVEGFDESGEFAGRDTITVWKIL